MSEKKKKLQKALFVFLDRRGNRGSERQLESVRAGIPSRSVFKEHDKLGLPISQMGLLPPITFS
jgi:hypothetical protein